MKKLIVITLFFLAVKTYGQSPIVHDPKNNVQLVKLGLFLKKVQEYGKDAVEVLKTAKVIQTYSKATEFVRAIEESYCIIQDLDLYMNLAGSVNITNAGCWDNVNYMIQAKGLENAIWQTLMAVESTVMSLGERQKAMQDAFVNLKDSNKELNEMKEDLRRRYESKSDMENSLGELAKM